MIIGLVILQIQTIQWIDSCIVQETDRDLKCQ